MVADHETSQIDPSPMIPRTVSEGMTAAASIRDVADDLVMRPWRGRFMLWLFYQGVPGGCKYLAGASPEIQQMPLAVGGALAPRVRVNAVACK
jgi:hypothetical protein